MQEDKGREGTKTDLPYDQVDADNDRQVDFNNDDVNLAPYEQDLAPKDTKNEDAGEQYLGNYNEETASEIMPSSVAIARDEPEEGNYYGAQETEKAEQESRTAIGWTGLVLSVLSLFFLPVLLAIAGIATGYFAIRGGAKTLGLWAIGIGAFSLVMGLFFTPFVIQ